MSERKMSEKTLDLEELADEIVRVEYPTYERAIPGVREEDTQRVR